MSNSASIALSHQMALRNQLDIIANNVANGSTAGFQGQRILFQEFLAKPKTGDELSYVHDIGVVRDVSAGPIEPTGNPLDVAIQGSGYFAIENDQGIFYTRNGSFRLDADGQLVTPQGFAVLGEGNVPFVFAPGETDIQISREGDVSTENGTIGRLKIVSFDNEQNMTPVGDGLLETNEVPIEVPETLFVQGALETANIRPVVEMTRMIEVLRAYQGASRVVETEDERLRRAIQSLTRNA